jgi:hypothetical protein
LYAIRALYRIISLSKNKVGQFGETLSQVLSKFIVDAAGEEDSSANYVYILFETTALTLKYLSSNADALIAFQNKLSESLNQIIQNNKTDLMGYAFQIYSLFVATSAQINPLFEALL